MAMTQDAQALPLAKQDEGAQPQQQQPASVEPSAGMKWSAPDAQPSSSAQPSQAVPTSPPTTVAQSEPTPDKGASGRPILDPRPYSWLAEHAPDKRAMVDSIATETGASPQRIALHWYAESGFKENVADGAAGEKGPGQVMPATFDSYQKRGLIPRSLDINNPVDNLRATGYISRDLDQRYGRDTPSSVGAYQGGPGSVDDMVAHPEMASKSHPTTMQYVQNAFPGFQIDPSQHFTGPSNLTPQGLVNAGTQGGPDGFLKYVAQTAPQGMPLSEAWDHAEGMLTKAFLEKGDIAGAQHARDYVLQMSHAGSNQWLMHAHQALSAGDSAGAAQALAKAHAFFPDGTVGQFGVDGKGQLWASRMDEHNPGKLVGKPFQVTPPDIAGMLNQTTDPNKYLASLLEQQKAVTAMRHEDNMSNFHMDQVAARQDSLGERTAYHQHELDQREADRLSREQIARDNREQRTGAVSREADKQISTMYGSDAMPDASPLQRANMGAVHKDVMMQGADPATAETTARGLADKTLSLVRGQDGRYGVVDAKNPNSHPIAYLSPSLGARLAGSKGPAQQGVPTTPVGAGAGTASARAAGVGQDLTGTTQSSAVPTTAGR